MGLKMDVSGIKIYINLCIIKIIVHCPVSGPITRVFCKYDSLFISFDILGGNDPLKLFDGKMYLYKSSSGTFLIRNFDC